MDAQLTAQPSQKKTQQPQREQLRRPAVAPAAPHHSLLQLQTATGNQAVSRLIGSRQGRSSTGGAAPAVIQAKSHHNQGDDPFEREADRLAQSAGDHKLARSQNDPQTPVPVSRLDGSQPRPRRFPPPGGQPLPEPARVAMEDRFGRDFSRIRIHTDSRAAEQARGLQARAFTVGSHISFGAGTFTPGSSAGRSLLAHELAHVVQQGADISPSGGSAASPGPVQRQEDPQQKQPSLPPVQIPRTGLTLFPGPLTASIGQIPLPGSLRLTNTLGAGNAPSFVLDLSPRLLVATILSDLELASSTRPGTPPGAEGRPENQARTTLVRPIISLDPRSGKLRGTATLSVGSEYPTTLKGPTNIDVDISSTELGKFSGKLGYGPLEANFNLRLHYDTSRLEKAASPVFAPQGGFEGFWTNFQSILRASAPGIKLESLSGALQGLLQSLVSGSLKPDVFALRTVELVGKSIPAGADLEGLKTAVKNFATEITHPGFTLRGGLGLNLGRVGTLPLTSFKAHAPTTVPLERPLLGAPAAFPLTYSAGGAVVAPPGALFDVAAPALGYTYSSFGATRGTSFTAAALPTLSPSAISAGEDFVSSFPVYAYAEFSHVRRVSSGLDLGVRIFAQVSSPIVRDLASGGKQEQPGDLNEQLRGTIEKYQEASKLPSEQTPVTPNVGVTVFGRFNAL